MPTAKKFNNPRGLTDIPFQLPEVTRSEKARAKRLANALAEHYPDAKVILTVRDANSWFESTHETILSPRVSEFIKNAPWGQMIQKTIWDTLDNRMGERDFMVDYFERRNLEIQSAVPSERLLVYQVKEGWEPLCQFLQVAVPDTDFPRINSRDETKALFESLMASSGEQLSDDAMAASARELHGKSE